MLISSLERPGRMKRLSVFNGLLNSLAARRACLAGFVIASALLFLLNTHQGIGILPDSTRYMRLSPTPYDAPLYTWMLAAMGSMAGRDAGAALLGALLVCLNTVLIWRLLQKGTGSLLATALGSAIILFSPQFVGLHAVAMSEPLFLATLFITVTLFLRYKDDGQTHWLVLCAVTLALAMLVRFAALPLAATFSVLLIADRRRPMRVRIRELMTLGMISAAIFFAWMILSQLSIGHSVGRELAFNGNTDAERWNDGLRMLTVQLLPAPVPYPLRLAFLATVISAVAILATSSARARTEDRGTQGAAIPAIFGLYGLFYLAFMVLSVSIEANLNLNGRYILPFFIAVAITATCMAANSAHLGRVPRMAAQVLLGCGCIIIASHIVRTAELTRENYRDGIGYASRSWQTSPIVQAVDALPPNAAIYSNGPDALNYLTPRTTAFTPFRIQRRTGRDNPHDSFGSQIERLRAKLADGNSYVVIMDKVDWRFYLATEPALIRAADLKLLRAEEDGRIYVGSAVNDSDH